MSETTTIDLLRHGEPVGGRKFRGLVDDPLSEAGWRHMRQAVGDHHPWNRLITSPLSRCAAFSRELARRHGIPLEIEPRFRELSFGDWDGHLVADIDANDPQALGRFWCDPLNHAPPGGESLAAFDTRVTVAWEELVEQQAGGHLLVVCHGGIIRVVLGHILEMPLARLWRLAVPYASLSRVRYYGGGDRASPQLLFHAGTLP
ncbi:MAG: alpha-ribazole phosphatase family protein [Candidatus Competibacteraceae bacterium]|nr:alpha-ribazole phosphatase family protein [Candidatus Competibacteraceae bacterium]